MSAARGEHAVDQVRPIERADEFERIAQRELRGDVAPDARGGRGGVGVHADAGELVAQARELAVFGTEVVAPLADAVRFVHRPRSARRTTARRDTKPSPPSPTRRSGDTYSSRKRRSASPRTHVGLVLARVASCCSSAAGTPLPTEGVHLVLHQRDERRDHDRPAASATSGGRLKTERLAAAGGQHHDRVAAGQHGLHGLALQRPERGVAPVAGDGRLRAGKSTRIQCTGSGAGVAD